MLVRLPQPYDFDALDRPLRRLRPSTGPPSGATAASIASSPAARCGSRLRPAVSTSRRTTRRSRRRCSTCSGCPSISTASTPGRRATRSSARLATGLAGFRPPLQVNPFEALVTSITAQQVSLQSAAAIRSRFIERFGVAGVHAHAFPERERVARATRGRADRRRLLDPQGGVRHRSRPQRPRPGRARIAAGRGGDRPARRAPRARRVDRGLVPRPAPREAARLARRRPGTAQGGRRVLW